LDFGHWTLRPLRPSPATVTPPPATFDIGPKDIGAKLGISRKTVTSHRARILIRMNMKSDAELTISFERNKPPDRPSVGEKPQYSPKPQPCRAAGLHEGYFPLNGWCLPSPSPL